MKLITRTTSTHEDDHGDCEFALIVLTPDDAREILNRMDVLTRLHATDQAVHEIHYWDLGAGYFEAPIDTHLDEYLDAGWDTYTTVPDDVEIPEACLKRTDCEHLVVASHGPEPEASWRASLHSRSAWMRTTPLPRSLVAAISRNEPIPKSR
jgi:hypothetical protein